MRPAYGLPALVPSSSLLRFLRFQVQEGCFSSTSSDAKAAVCHRLTSQPTQPFSCRHKLNAYPVSSKIITTSQCHQTNAGSSRLGADFLVQTNKNHIRNPLSLASTSRRGTLPSCPSLFNPSSRRQASTGFRRVRESIGLRHIKERLHWPNKRSDGPELKRKDLPPIHSFLEDASRPVLGRSKVGKAANELKLRCTEWNKNGKVTTVTGEFKKTELIAKYGLLPRDLRKIDSALLPHILVRPSAILMNLLHLRVLIKHDRVLLIDAYGTTDSHTVSRFMHDLQGKLELKDSSRQAGGLPYEFRALEAVLISVTGCLEEEFGAVSEPVVRVLRELEEDIDRDKLRHLLIYSKAMGSFEQKARLVRDAIDDLLNADDDLVSMYLSERAQGKKRQEDDHTEVEMLLESYHKVCDEIVQSSSNLVNNIRNTEEIVKAILDANRNSLMLLDLKFSIGTLGIGSGAFIAGLYGMNLQNFIEESNLGFAGISSLSFAFAALICVFGLQKLRRVQRVSMYGERGRKISEGQQHLLHHGFVDSGTTPATGATAAGENCRLDRGEGRRVGDGVDGVNNHNNHHDRHLGVMGEKRDGLLSPSRPVRAENGGDVVVGTHQPCK